MKETALSKVRTNELAALLTNIAIEDAKEIEAMRRAKAFPPGVLGLAVMMEMVKKTDAELLADGWTREDLHVAIGANMNSKEAPLYLKITADRFALRYRDGVGEKASKAAKVVVPIQVNVTQAERDRAPVINVGEEVGR